MFKEYVVWKQFFSESDWTTTNRTLMARTDKEAQAKLRRKFAESGFSYMALVAVEFGKNPNT